MVLKGSLLIFTYYGLFYPLLVEEEYEFMNTYTMTVTEHWRVQRIYVQTCIYAVIYQQSILTLQSISFLSCLLSFTSTPLNRYTGSILKDNHECTLLLSSIPYYHFMPYLIKIIHWKMENCQKDKKEKREFHIPNPFHIKHLPTPFAEKFNHRPHVFFWHLHSGNLQAIHMLGTNAFRWVDMIFYQI